MERELYEELTREVTDFLSRLQTDGRVTIVANYYVFPKRVKVGFDVDQRAAYSEITSASRVSPVGNVVSRLSEAPEGYVPRKYRK